MTLLWPDADEDKARRALTQGLYALRQDFGDDDAIAGVKELRLDLSRLTTDLHDFLQAKAEERLADAALVYRGSFLDGFHLTGADEFERWAEQERLALAREYASIVERLATAYESRGDYTSAVEWRQRLTALDPLNAGHAVAYMRALASAGDAHGAIHHARIHEALLEQQLNLPADHEVIALAGTLRREARRQSTESQMRVDEEQSDLETAPSEPTAPVVPTPVDAVVEPVALAPRRPRSRVPVLIAAGILLAGVGGAIVARPRGPDTSEPTVAVSRATG
jgi:DNA-binding SARP family transcriptional activator